MTTHDDVEASKNDSTQQTSSDESVTRARRVIPPPAIRSRSDSVSPITGIRRDVGVVIVAAGSGTRTGSSELKQFRWVAGKPALLHSVQAFMARDDVAIVVVVMPRSHAADPPPWLFQCDVDRLLISTGGATRHESVINGLEDLPEETTIAVVHDAARPLVSDKLIDRVISEARKGHGAIAAIPVADTLKEVDDDGRIVRTVDRTKLWRAQTPQAFPRELLERAHVSARENGYVATDDASLVEMLGEEVVVVRGSERAFKITEEQDFALAEALSTFED
jgi:2-C-methyl-D-erythritol 4-phosphate cytidylyltransferase